MTKSSLVDPTTGKALEMRASTSAALGGRSFWRGGAYDAGHASSQDLGEWHPYGYSADAALANERDLIRARLHDLVRNDGWLSGAVTAFVNAAVGPNFRLSSKPDWRRLGITFDQALELGDAIETLWRNYCDDPRKFCDARRRSTMSGLFYTEFRHEIVDGESLCLPLWRPQQRQGTGFGFATTFQIVDPARLSNPNDRPDEQFRRGGVQLDQFGAAIGYHFRRSHPGDLGALGALDSVTWDFVEREWPWGRPKVIHSFLPLEAEQTRGVSPFTPLVRMAKMIGRWSAAEVQAAVANSILAAWIETSLPPDAAAEVLSDGNTSAIDDRRAAFYEKHPQRLEGFRIPVLPLGDSINFPMAARPNREAGAFADLGLRYFAAATGMNPSTISRNYANTNYSSERAAMLEGWRTISTKRVFFAQNNATPKLACLLEEAIDRGLLILPPGAPDFWDAPAAYLAGDWIGAARGWVDEVKEATASQMRVDGNVATLESENASQGRDWEDTLEQRAREKRRLKELGLDAAPAITSLTERETEDGNERTTETTLRREGAAA